MEQSQLIAIVYICVQLSAVVAISIVSANIVNGQLSSETTTTNNVKSWAKFMWKMRGIYGSFFVHSFDTLTDVLIIYDWWFKEEKEGDISHINSRIMAYSAIAVIIEYRTISAISIWVKYNDLQKCLFQFLDVLIFQEIYYSHLKIVDEIHNKTNKINQNQTTNIENSENTRKNDISIDATICFKYIRNMEAIFESMPQSILQLVYAMRTSKIEVIYVLSVMQSIISMTNSIINNDHMQMTLPHFKSYKKKFPPSFKFMKHFLVRTSEVIYRIGLLSLVWNVCEGLPFVLVLCYESVLLISYKIIDIMVNEDGGMYGALGLFQIIIVMPSEFMFDDTEPLSEVCCWGARPGNRLLRLVNNIFCCYWIGAVLTTLWRPTGPIAPSCRIAASVAEISFMILYAVFYNNGERLEFLFSPQHGLYVFIVTLICLIIFTQYQSFFPHISLPNNVDPLSRYGAAFNGELSELKKIDWSDFKHDKSKCCGCCGCCANDTESKEIKSKEEFWNKPDENGVTCIIYALSNEQFHVVAWLKEEGASLIPYVPHAEDVTGARALVGDKYWPNEINQAIDQAMIEITSH